jgi:hypothetical protein
MTPRPLGNRAKQALNSVSDRPGTFAEASGAWPTAGELEPGFASIDPQAHVATEVWGSEDFDLGLVCGASDRRDTIPSPPPEFESAPSQDERWDVRGPKPVRPK